MIIDEPHGLDGSAAGRAPPSDPIARVGPASHHSRAGRERERDRQAYVKAVDLAPQPGANE
jgi:hypothetical protein